MAVPGYLRGPRSSSGARFFGRAALAGGRPGRPTTNATFQFAGDPTRLSPAAQQLIAAQRWGERRGRQKPETAPQQRSISSGADIASARGSFRSERQFDGERRFFSPNALREGGSGSSPANPWS